MSLTRRYQDPILAAQTDDPKYFGLIYWIFTCNRIGGKATETVMRKAASLTRRSQRGPQACKTFELVYDQSDGFPMDRQIANWLLDSA
ncbi:UNVERIFIED_CONTAM: hypothetical protein Slati_0079500 [Sesamum latifolium]|uniref:Uncharacterized protein n=1 Tax=Sesamum latifolium TaxID=2727402 RepID=A0AAW2Y7Y5_9LAMI